MKIDAYSFGKIVIDGVLYTSDVIIYPDHVVSAWWRKEGHYLQTADLADALTVKPDVLIIGTGKFGVMTVPEKTTSFLTSKGIDVKIARTDKALELFNTIQGQGRVVAALHLTC